MSSKLEVVDYTKFDYGDEVARWFATEAYKITDTGELIQQTGERLWAAGIPIYRLGYFQRVLHPEQIGRGYFWRRGQTVDFRDAPKDIVDTADYVDNPLPLVFQQGRTVRVRLSEATDLHAPLLQQLKEEGATDYVALPVAFADGHRDALSVTSDAPQGFSRQDLDRMFALQVLFARIVEIHNLRQTAVNLLNTYVGHQAGEQILQGRIRRGDSNSLRAVLWLSDLRNFTPLSDRLARGDILHLLNDYFDCAGAAIEAEGGEILKFIGDAVLAVFPCAPAQAQSDHDDRDNRDDRDVAAAALRAAQSALTLVAARNEARRSQALPEIELGIGLHVGDVMYGNIGAPTRLDFTVVGPAVNYVARIESLCKKLSKAILMSREFAKLLPEETAQVGRFALKGIAEAQEIFTANAQ